MRIGIVVALALAGAMLSGCGSPPPAPSPKVEVFPRITQLYAPQPEVGRGDEARICYGVEDARSVWISPPVRELSAALARCIDVEPQRTTTYTLTAEGSSGKRVSQDITITVGAPRVRIENVNVSADQVRPGETVVICYQAVNARSVTVLPLGYQGGPSPHGCVSERPLATTRYVVTATGVSGDTDKEEVTVRVR